MGKRGLRIILQGMVLLLVSAGAHTGVWAPAAVAETLNILVGAGLRQPMDQLVRNFEAQTGHRVFIDYGGSGKLLAQIQASGKGDLFVPGAFFYIDKLEAAGKVRFTRPMVQHTPVIGVNAHQAERVSAFEDLAKPGIRLAMGDAKAMALGRTAAHICVKSGLKAAIDENVKVYGATVKQLVMYVSQGSVDAAIIGRADAFQNREKIVIVDIPKRYFQAEIIAAAVLWTSPNPDIARNLCEFLASPEAIAVFEGYGFLPTGS